jgi:hypothetical protein
MLWLVLGFSSFLCFFGLRACILQHCACSQILDRTDKPCMQHGGQPELCINLPWTPHKHTPHYSTPTTLSSIYHASLMRLRSTYYCCNARPSMYPSQAFLIMIYYPPGQADSGPMMCAITCAGWAGEGAGRPRAA